MQNNIDAVLEVMKFIYDHIMYAELNTKTRLLPGLRFRRRNRDQGRPRRQAGLGPARSAATRDQSKMNVARRTCGYIGTQYWNQGRTQEIRDRVLHL